MTETWLYALGGLVAAEAVGVTNLTGGGDGSERGDSQPIINIPDRGAGGSSLSPGDLAGLIGQDSGGIDAGTVAALVSGSKSPSEIVIESGAAEGQERINELVTTLEEEYEKTKEQVRDETTGDFGGSLWDAGTSGSLPDPKLDPKKNQDTLGKKTGRIGTHTFITGPAEGSLNELGRFTEENVTDPAGDVARDTGSFAEEKVNQGASAVESGWNSLTSTVGNEVNKQVDQEKREAEFLADQLTSTPITGTTGARLI